uniref:Vacuolar protein sortingassociated protein 37Alike [Ceratitis capitata] n=1 Tax=Lepeophtheirus salmonis TaxID=72036 RepID=A0A0K2USM3_LEPSM
MDYRALLVPTSYPTSIPSDYSLEERLRQIKTLHIFNENVNELTPNLHYRVDFNREEEGEPLALFLTLGPYFPREPPEIYLSPAPTHHPWTDTFGRVVRAPGLLAYNGQHTDLGRLVQAIKRQFQLTPLTIVSSTPNENGQNNYTNSSTTPAPPLPSSIRSPPNTTATKNSFYTTRPFPPPLQEDSSSSVYFPELAHLSIDKLKELDSDPTSLKYFYKTECDTRRGFIERHDEELSSLRTELKHLETNNSTAAKTLESETSELRAKKGDLESFKSKLISETERFVALKKEIGGLPEVCDKFRKASHQREDESDRIAEQFLDGEFQNIDAFLKEYLPLRNEYHKRKSQSEKLGERLRKKSTHFPF